MPQSAQPTGLPIDLEELAAFIDGRLTGERRQRVLALLAEDEDAYALYDEVIRVREELATAEAAGARAPENDAIEAQGAAAPSAPPAEIPVAPQPPRQPAERRVWTFPTVPHRRTVGWFPVAAAAAAAVAVFGVWWLLRPLAPEPSTALLAAFDPATLTPEAAGSAPESLGTSYRGLDGEERAALFELGVRAFDLALAVEARDRESTARWLAEMARLLDQGVPLGFGLPEIYEQLAARLTAGAAPRELRAGIAAAEATLQADLDDPSQPLFAFGRWVEAVRFAAGQGDRAFLASPAARRPLKRFLRAGPSDEVARQLARVAAALGRGAASADLAAVEDALERIETHCADARPCLGPATE